jgi:hypothetical protein
MSVSRIPESVPNINPQPEDMFYMVFVEGNSGPGVKHTKTEAKSEAVRLARHTGKKTYILKAVGFVQKQEPPVVMVEYHHASNGEYERTLDVQVVLDDKARNPH